MSRTLGALLLLVATTLVLAPAPAQDAPGGVLYTQAREFRVPFSVGPGTQALSQLRLYVSTDAGRTWDWIDSAAPEQAFFRYKTSVDGTFWFAVQSFDKANRAFPTRMEGATPNLKVIVDNRPPSVSVQPIAARPGEVGVSWIVRDDNYFDAGKPDAIRVEYLSAGGNWLPLTVPSGANQLSWVPSGAGPYKVRVQARDQAKNVADAFTDVRLDGGGGPLTPAPNAPNPSYNRNYEGPGAVHNPPAQDELKYVNNKKVKLSYDLDEDGPSGVKSVDLWYTQDGRTWKPHGQAAVDQAQKTLTFDLEREGQFGVTLVVKSGAGLGVPPPNFGDRPQMWIEVDTTKPVVSVRSPLVGQHSEKGKLKITWSATDKNLGHDCIMLKYAEKTPENWAPILKEKIGNTGEFTWTMPKDIHFQIFIKVEAVDKAGNLGEDFTSKAVNVDLSMPRAIPKIVSPAH